MTNKEIMAAYRYAYKMAGDAYEGEAPAPAKKRPVPTNDVGRAVRFGQDTRSVCNNQPNTVQQ